MQTERKGKGAVGNRKQRQGVSLCRSGGEGQRLHVTGAWWLVVCFLVFVCCFRQPQADLKVLGGRGCKLKRLFS